MNIFELFFFRFAWVLRSALLGILAGICCYAVFNVSVALATSCFTHEELKLKVKSSKVSDERYAFPKCALLSGSREDYASEGLIQNSGASDENFSLIYQIEANP